MQNKLQDECDCHIFGNDVAGALYTSDIFVVCNGLSVLARDDGASVWIRVVISNDELSSNENL